MSNAAATRVLLTSASIKKAFAAALGCSFQEVTTKKLNGVFGKDSWSVCYLGEQIARISEGGHASYLAGVEVIGAFTAFNLNDAAAYAVR